MKLTFSFSFSFTKNSDLLLVCNFSFTKNSDLLLVLVLVLLKIVI